MAAGIDVSVAGNKSADSLDPLVRALDQYSGMLQGVVNALQQIKFPEFPEFPSIKEELEEFLAQLSGQRKRQDKLSEIRQLPTAPAKDVRYNPELDVALGITPPPSAPETPKLESTIFLDRAEEILRQAAKIRGIEGNVSPVIQSPDIQGIQFEAPEIPAIKPVKIEPPKVPELTAPPISAPKMPGLEPIKLDVPEITAIEPIQLNAPKVEDIQAPVIQSPAIPEIEPIKLTEPKPTTQKASPQTPPAPEPTSAESPIKDAMSAFKGLGNVGNIAGTVAKGLGGLAIALDVGTKVVEEVFDLIESALEPLDDAIKAVGDALQPLADLISTTLKTVLAPFMAIMEFLGSVLKAVTFPMMALMRVIKSLIDVAMLPLGIITKTIGKALQLLSIPLRLLESIVSAIIEVFDELLVPIDMLIMMVELVADAIPDWIKSMSKSAKAQKDSIKIITDLSKTFKDTVKNLLINPFEVLPSLINQIRESVDLFNPGAIMDFDLAMRDLQAVFGEFFAPMVKEAAIVVRSFADTLRPILLAAAPIFQKLIGAVGDQLLANISLFAETLALAIPGIVAFINAQVHGAERQLLLMEKWRRADSLFKMLAFPFEMMLKTNKGLKADIKEARKNDAPGGIMGRAQLPGAQGLAVAYNAAFKSIADIGKESMLQAFIGTSSMASLKNAKRQKAEDNIADLKNVIKDAGKNAFLEALEQHDKRKPAAAGGILGNIFGGGK